MKHPVQGIYEQYTVVKLPVTFDVLSSTLEAVTLDVSQDII